MKKLALLFWIFIVFYGCSTAPKVDIQAEKDAIQKIADQWTAEIKVQNTDNIMKIIASDAVFMINEIPIIVGKDAIRESEESWFSDTTIVFSTFEATIEIIEVSGSGDFAYTRGRERFSQNTSAGTIERVSKWINIWKKIDGEWKVAVVIGNSDKPL